MIKWNDSEVLKVHADQLKPWIGDKLQGTGTPMEYRCTDPHDDLPMKIAMIRAHRKGLYGLEFLVHWEGSTPMEDTWEPIASFVRIRSHEWRDYCDTHQLPISWVVSPSTKRGAWQ